MLISHPVKNTYMELALNCLEMAFNSVGTPLVIMDADENFELIISEVNAAFEKLSGLAKEDCIGRAPVEILKKFSFDSFERHMKEIRNCYAGAQTITYLHCFTLNGMLKYFLTQLTPGFAPDGSVVQITSSSMDITEFYKDKFYCDCIAAKNDYKAAGRFNEIIWQSASMNKVYAAIETASDCTANILIEGESGTGKNLAARAIHNISSRKSEPFIIVNCSSFPETLLESELFGYVRGAFTDAYKDKPGKFESAGKGTLMLDEISEIPLHLQVKLLRIIDEKNFEPLGSNRNISLKARIIAASNKDLKKLVREGKFREDLYYRLKVLHLMMPPLRERKQDINLLADYFIGLYNKKYNKKIKGISEYAISALKKYEFPGNVRELSNIIERACVFCEADMIDETHFSDEYRSMLIPCVKLSCRTSENYDAISKDGSTCKEDSLYDAKERSYQLLIYQTIKNNPCVKIKELSSLTGLSIDGVKYHIRKLKTLNKVQRIGTSHHGYYKATF